jgi:hypothetical protein
MGGNAYPCALPKAVSGLLEANLALAQTGARPCDVATTTRALLEPCSSLTE